MAVELKQEPTSPNVSYTKLMYVVSCSSAVIDNPQYKYVADVFYSGSAGIEAVRLARLKTVPNPEGVGVFDLSAVYQGYLGYDENWETLGIVSNESSSRPFQVLFGEEWSTSVSGSVIVYPGDNDGAAGNPNVSSSAITVFKGTLDPTIYNTYNFNQNPFDTASMANDSDRGPRLSDSPFGYAVDENVISLSTSDFHTITVLGGQMDSGYELFKASCSVEYADTPITSSFGIADYSSSMEDLVTIGCGPQNLISQSAYISSSLLESGSWAVYTVDLYYTGSGGQLTSSYYFGNDIYNLGGFAFGNAIPFSSFSLKPPLNTCIGLNAGFGDYNSAMAVGGGLTGSAPIISGSEQWNGSTWSLSGDMTYTRREFAGCGVSNVSGIVNGGIGNGPGDFNGTYTCEGWNGVTWTLLANMAGARSSHATIGTEANAITTGGSGGLNTSEIYNGASWSSGPTLPLNKADHAGAGKITAGLFWGGAATGGTLLWNGSAFSTTSEVPNGPLADLAGTGKSTSALTAGGGNGVIATHYYDGEVWEVGPFDYPYEWGRGAGAGQNSDALFFGGFSASIASGPLIKHYCGIDTVEAISEPTINTEYIQSPTTYPVCYPPTKFAFINNYGVWDYVQMIYPIEKVTDLKRESITLPQPNYSLALSPYDISKRGKTTYYTKPKSKYKVSTGYLPQDEADWLPQLLESPSVYIQENGQFEGIVITNKDYRHKTNPRGQKVFKFDIEFEYANNDRARL